MPDRSTSTASGAVVDRAGGEDDRVDVVAREQLGVAADGRLRAGLPQLLGAPLAGRRDRHELGPGQPLGVLGVDGPHPAEAGDAEPKRTRRP